MAKLGLRLNLRNQGLSQYQGYEFDSMVEFNGKPLGFGPSGIHQLFTGDNDNGKAIQAIFDLPTTEMKTTRNKWIRSIYLSMSGNGKIRVTVTDDEHYSHSYLAVVRLVDKQHVVKIKGGRNWNKGCFYSFRFENVEGSDFDIDSMQVVPVVSNRQPGKF